MARPPRLEFSRAIHHVPSRGDRREHIHVDHADREAFPVVRGSVCVRFNRGVHARHLVENHDHLLIETPDGRLARGT